MTPYRIRRLEALTAAERRRIVQVGQRHKAALYASQRALVVRNPRAKEEADREVASARRAWLLARTSLSGFQVDAMPPDELTAVAEAILASDRASAARTGGL